MGHGSLNSVPNSQANPPIDRCYISYDPMIIYLKSNKSRLFDGEVGFPSPINSSGWHSVFFFLFVVVMLLLTGIY